ncbi:MAG: lysophospholipid acyltransferase family protein [Hyphomonadaceae bacterium]
MRFIRSLAFVVWLYVTMAILGIFFAPIVFFLRGFGITVMRLWAHLTLFALRWIVGARVTIEGREHLPIGGCVVAMKHQSMLDTIVPFLFLKDPAIVYKQELSRAPIFGWYLARTHMIPVARESHAVALKAMLRAAREAAAAGREIFIFPEGTRQWLGAKPDYKPGVAALYRDLNLPCAPVATNSGVVWKPKGLMRSPGHVYVKILPPIAPGLPRAEFMAELQARIETASEALLPDKLKRAA